MKAKTREEVFDIVAVELCKRVSLPYPPPEGTVYNVKDKEWTEEEEMDFRKWLTKYLKTVPLFKGRGPKYIEKEVEWFIFQYGWAYKDPTNGESNEQL